MLFVIDTVGTNDLLEFTICALGACYANSTSDISDCSFNAKGHFQRMEMSFCASQEILVFRLLLYNWLGLIHLVPVHFYPHKLYLLFDSLHILR